MFFLTKYHILLLALLIVLGGIAGFLVSETPPQRPANPSRFDVPAGLPQKVGIIRHLTVLDPAVAGFKQGMTELGYTEGKNIVYDIQRATEGQSERIRQIAQDYVNQDVDLIFAIDDITTRVALEETERTGKTDIPILFAYAENPVETALVRSFLSSSNNVTGVAVDLKGVTEKKLEFLQQIDPGLQNLGVFVTRYSTPEEKLLLQELRARAPKLGILLVEYPLDSPPGPASTEELKAIAQNIQPGEIDAYYHLPDTILSRVENLQITGAMGRRLSIPTLYPSQEDLRIANGLMSYGHDVFAIGKQAATMADQILKGEHPQHIPLQSPAKNLLILNQDAAEDSAITLPPTLLDIADKLLPLQP